MLRLRNLLVVICGVLIASGAVSEVKKAVGDEVSFQLDKIDPSFTSITWKQISSSGTVKAIEWEDKVIDIPNSRFKGITTLDTTTGQITIMDLKLEHSGVYTIDVSGKEQTQRFTLTVMERVPKPEIKIEPTGNTDVVYLICEYSETIIWKNSTGGILKGSARQTKGEELVVKKEGNPENFYTCSLQNAVSEDTSDRIYERNLFKDGSSVNLVIAIIATLIIFIVCAVIALYIFNKGFRDFVNGKCPCIKDLVDRLCPCMKDDTKQQVPPQDDQFYSARMDDTNGQQIPAQDDDTKGQQIPAQDGQQIPAQDDDKFYTARSAFPPELTDNPTEEKGSLLSPTK